MPLYEYECRACGQRTEVLQRLSAPPLTTCENCGGELKKLISSPAFQFKGSGWYVTDYARKGEAKGGGEAAEGGAGESDKADKASKTDKADKAESPAAGGKSDKPAAKSKSDKPAKTAGDGSS